MKSCDVSYGPSEMVQAARTELGEQPEGVVSVNWPTDGTSGDGGEGHRYAVALDQAWMVAIDTTLTPELKDEGTAREVVHRIQNLRRNAGFELTDRITTFYGADQESDELRRVMSDYAPYIQQETLSDQLVEGSSARGERHRKAEGGGVGGGVGGAAGVIVGDGPKQKRSVVWSRGL